MENEERRLLGLVLAMVLLVTGQGCGSAAMNGEQGNELDNPNGELANPDTDPEPEPEPDAEAELAPVTNLQAELVMLCGYQGPLLWGTSENDMFMAGEDGLLAHFDGARWAPFDLGSNYSYRDFSALIGFSSTDVFAGNSNGDLLHYDGETWTEVEVPNVNSIDDLWGTSANDLYAIYRSRVMHFDGAEWSTVDTGLPTDVRWLAISGSGSDHVVLVGFEPQAPYAPRFAHFDGSDWEEHEVPTTDRLVDVWSAGPSATFAIGQSGSILRFDGQELTAMQGTNGQALQSIWGTSATEVFVAGEGSIRRFDGSTWSSMVSPSNPDVGFPQRFRSLFGFGGNRLFASGKGLHFFDGESWEVRLSHSSSINKIWATSPEDVLFVGSATHRYDGFTVEPEDFGGFEQPNLRAAWGTKERTYAAGGGGEMFVYDGENWARMTSNTSTTFFDITGTSEDDVFAVGYNGVIVHFNGAAWGGMISGTDAHLRGVWAAAPDDVYAVGYEGTILHYDGNEWATLFGNEELYYWHVTGFDSEHIVAPHPGGVHFGDGVSWRSEQPEFEDAHNLIEAVHGTSPDNMFAVGYGGLSHYDGETWTHVSALRPGGSQAVFAVGPRDVYMSGRQGVLRFTVPSP
ncbi:MAG: hypothetical protein ACN4G0_05010 [Polyangiales bacterium]